jgi:hypothetical protein
LNEFSTGIRSLPACTGDYLGDMARAVFEQVGRTAPVQVVGGSTSRRRNDSRRRGCAFVISGNMGHPDSDARYDLAEVSSDASR